MKKIIMSLAMMGLFSVNLSLASNDCRDCADKNKVTHNKVVRTTGNGLSSGYYYTTHNKLTKVLKINDGNIKHSKDAKVNRSTSKS